MTLFRDATKKRHDLKKLILETVLVATIGSLSASAMDNPLMSLFRGGEDDEETKSIHNILTTELPKNQNTFVMDSQKENKIYLRKNGDDKSILIFSMETKVHGKGSEAHSSLPDLKLYDGKSLIIDYLKRQLEETHFPKTIVKIRPSRWEFHARELEGKDRNINGKRCLEKGYTNEEIMTMETYKKRAINLDFDRNEELYNTLQTKEIDVSVVFSYYNRTRELVISLKTDSTQESLDSISPFAERIHDFPEDFFTDIASWMELTLEEKKNYILKEKGKKTGMHG